MADAISGEPEDLSNHCKAEPVSTAAWAPAQAAIAASSKAQRAQRAA
jgi:hypothetical protein